MTVTDPIERATLQRSTIRTLMVGVVPAGAALSAGFSSAALLGKEVTDSSALGTLAASFFTIGTALSTVPLAQYMAERGRRPGLRVAWSIAIAGALLAFASAIVDLYPLLVLGVLGMGVGNAASLAARYAAADLAEDDDRARAIGLLVWAGSFGTVLGPTLGLGVVGTAAEWLGLPKLAGPYLMGMVLLAAAVFWIDRRLRPDPLVAAGGLSEPEASSRSSTALAMRDHFTKAGRSLRQIFRHPSARLAVVSLLVSHAVMVGVMTATPLHMEDGSHELQIIGFVISVHIVGMYFFAPLVGWLVDRIGSRPVIAFGGAILFAGAELASHSEAEDDVGVFVGLFLVGLGWSFGLIAGSSLLTASFPISERVNVQGAADLVMSAAGAAASLAAGVVYEFGSYHTLSHYAGLAAIGLSFYAAWRTLRTRSTGAPPPAVLSGEPTP